MRFPEFSGEWDSFKLVELGKFIGGGTPSSSNLSFWTGSIPWISSSDIKEDNINNISISRYITEDAIEKSATKYCPAPVILIVSRVGVGKVALSHTSLCTSQDFCNIIDIKCHPVFLSYNLLRTMKRKSREVQGTSIKGITSDELQKIRVFIPKNKDEQNKISNLLTLLDERIVTQNKIIEDLKKLKSAISLNVLHSDTWEQFKIKDIAKIGRGRVISSIEISQQKNPTYPVYSSQTSNNGIMGYLDDYMFEGEHISWTTDGANAGTVFYRNGKFNCTNVCGLLKFRKEFDTYFVSLVLAEATKKYVSINLANPKLMNNTMGNIQIRLPKLEEQKRISIVFRELQKLWTVHNSLLTKYTKQKQYLLSQMFI
ncbi:MULTISPECIES: restriction endonuclease subunit S [Bacteroides]|uniref:restriction endonuclease subunit S n=1 Tax=Bacteroides TaxID=816 RepID=UPI001FB37EB8|nr:MULTISPECIES: restriction endonuclease subunit S [Bacteroides]